MPYLDLPEGTSVQMERQDGTCLDSRLQLTASFVAGEEVAGSTSLDLTSMKVEMHKFDLH